MTEQNLSLDEMIELAKEFHRLGKWQSVSGSEPNTVLLSDEFADFHMGLSARNVNSEYSQEYTVSLGVLYTCSNAQGNMSIADYSVTREQNEYFEKLKNLFNTIYPVALTAQQKKERREQEELSDEEIFTEERRTKAIDAARKLIKK